MVLLVQRLSKLYHKLENHYHHHHHHQAEVDALSASLQAFRSDVSNCANQLLHPEPGSEILSFSWIQRCFELLPVINQAFLKLVGDIDYPMSCWDVASLDEYLNYGLHLLELLNCVTSSLSHLAQARLSFAHALNLVESSPSTAIEHLKAIQSQSSSKDLKELVRNKEGGEGKLSSCKERVVHEALMEVMVEKGETLKEVKELNSAANSLVSAILSGKTSVAAMDFGGKLGVFEKEMDALEKQVDALFSSVLAARNELLNGVRQRKQ
ncbi:hypothetical protein ES319_A08G152000v1 [Gossypium barbadense]|uniref:Uncharacterized protein n=2 Tax=Gossypium TaxID=3633 RepID=A0A5J5US87_GOSBA|nr:hypothetical protein ES319_A08G152000v1 [Gossypium barbadense]TYH06591.1 hypothetical protein ES288_A08G166900v1 [Gossypium darwinii]